MRFSGLPAFLFVLSVLLMLYLIAPRHNSGSSSSFGSERGSVTPSRQPASDPSTRDREYSVRTEFLEQELQRLASVVDELKRSEQHLQSALSKSTGAACAAPNPDALSAAAFAQETLQLTTWEQARAAWAAGLVARYKADASFANSRAPAARSDRGRFVSEAVENVIRRMSQGLRDPELAQLFTNCYPNTLDTTVQYSETAAGPDSYVITGDIDAMWLRDSTAQVWPYLKLMKKDEPLRKMVEGVVRRQTKYVTIDPHANAFFRDSKQRSSWGSDGTTMIPGVHERKYELDSLAAVLRLAAGYFEHSGDRAPFDDSWINAVGKVLDVIVQHQNPMDDGYTFSRQSPTPTETLLLRIGPGGVRCGLSKSPFRPSDDSSTLPFPVAANAMTAVSLKKLVDYGLLDQRPALKAKALALAEEIEAAIWKHGIVQQPVFGPVFAYEVDCAGSVLISDDANVPSLLSLPYLGFVDALHPVYKNTRRLLHSFYNPWYFRGEMAEGIGSPHAHGYDFIWPMSIIMRAMTSVDDDEILLCLAMLKATHADTGFMHESVHKDTPKRFTRHWFAWVNGLFGEMLVKVATERPELVLKPGFQL